MDGRIPIPPGICGTAMETGYAYCANCHDHILPIGDRQGEGHAAVRFGRDHRDFVVYEGDTKLMGVYEVMAGPGGWVIEIDPDASYRGCHVCGTPLPLRRVRYGNFAIARKVGVAQ